MAAELTQILNSIVTTVQSLNLTLNGTVIPVVKRKGVKREPKVDQATQITVSMEEGAEEEKYLLFTNKSIIYPIEITIVSPNNDDYLSNYDTYASWREMIKKQFLPPVLTAVTPFLGVPGVWNVRVRSGTFLDRTSMSHRYDEMTLFVDVTATLVAA